MLSDTLSEVNEILQSNLLHYATDSSTKVYSEHVVEDMIFILEKIDRLRTKLDTPPPSFHFGASPN